MIRGYLNEVRIVEISYMDVAMEYGIAICIDGSATEYGFAICVEGITTEYGVAICLQGTATK
jgi:hypothetical protein